MADETTTTGNTQTTGDTATDQAASLFPDQGKTPETTVKTDEVKVEDKLVDDTGAKVEETKGDEQTKSDAKSVVPETYDIKAPEGVTIDADALAAISPVLKELGITNEGAQKLADAQVAMNQAAAAKQTEAWLEASKTDKEIGGKQWEATQKLAQAGFAKWSTPEFKAFVELTGLGNHPEFLRTFAKLGKAGQEDTPVAGGPISETDHASVLFPNMNKS